VLWERSLGGDERDMLWPVLRTADSYLVGGTRDGDAWLRSVPRRIDGVVASDDSASTATMTFGEEPVSVVLAEPVNATNGSLTLTERAPGAVDLPGSPVYAAEVRVDEQTSFESARVVARFDRAALRERGIDATELRIARLDGDSWTFLETNRTVANGTVAVTAATPHFSIVGVTAIRGPTAVINSTGETVYEPGETIALNGTESLSGDGRIVSATWRVAGERRDGLSTTARFESPGVYDVTLRVVDEFGLADSAETSVVVNDRPSVSLRLPASATVGEPATLRAEVRDEVGETSVTWVLPSGNLTGATVKYTPERAGPVEVLVVVRDEHGERTVRTAGLDVDPKSTAGETADRPPATDGTRTTTPGFGAVVAVCALVLAGRLARRSE
jgi:PGF-CTERM protein